MHARRVEPDEERLLVGARLVDELQRVVEDFVVDRLHPLGIERAGVLDPLLADLAPARLFGGIVAIRGPGMDHVARADHVLQRLRIVPMRRVLHRVQMVEVAEELIEPVHGRQEFVEIAEMVLAELAGGVSHGLEDLRDRYRLVGNAQRRARLSDRRQSGPDRQFAGNEVCAPRRAACLGVIVGEAHSLVGQSVKIGSPPGHDALIVDADIRPADVIAHNHDDVRLLRLRMQPGTYGQHGKATPKSIAANFIKLSPISALIANRSIGSIQATHSIVRATLSVLVLAVNHGLSPPTPQCQQSLWTSRMDGKRPQTYRVTTQSQMLGIFATRRRSLGLISLSFDCGNSRATRSGFPCNQVSAMPSFASVASLGMQSAYARRLAARRHAVIKRTAEAAVRHRHHRDPR